jgi:hypothetical protein
MVREKMSGHGRASWRGGEVEGHAGSRGVATSPTPPITERILARLGRPRWLWVVAWSLIPVVSPLVYSTAIGIAERPIGTDAFINLVVTQAAIAYACMVFLVGSGVLTRQIAALREAIPRIAREVRPGDLFSETGSVRGPLVLTAIGAAVVSGGGWTRYGPLPPLASLPLLLVYLLPILTFIWVYLSILVEIDRLGRRPLVLDTFPQDPTLGLERLGWVASIGLGLVLVGAAPVMLAASDEPVTLAISLTIVTSAVAVYVLSMWRLHRQMAIARARFIVIAQGLYAGAYEPLRADPTVTTLEAQANALGAAQALEERARNLLTWPIEQGTLRFMAVVVTGVVTSLVVRGLFAALGFGG